MLIKFYCSQCDQRLSIDSKKAGKSIPCPACHNKITIPHTSEPRRSDKAPPSETQTEHDLPLRPALDLNQDEDQFLEGLNDLNDLSALGDSWDEILIDESNPPTETNEVDQEITEEQIHEEKITHENIDLEQPEQTIAEDYELDQPSKEAEKPTLSEIPQPGKYSKTYESLIEPPPSKDTFEDEDDDEDDAFSIRSAESEFEEMDLTPMVDVTFLLLIFFMITASFSLQKSIEVPPPNPDEDGVSQSLQTLDDFREESIIVEIDNQNSIYVDDTKLSNPSEIVQAILDHRNQDGKSKSELVLSAHKAARHETVVAVVDAANEVGMQKIRLASYRGPEN